MKPLPREKPSTRKRLTKWSENPILLHADVPEHCTERGALKLFSAGFGPESFGKSLIYELLPDVSNLPERMSSRSLAAELTNMLNYEETSELYLDIKQHTNMNGRIKDTAVQKLIMNSICRKH